MTKTRTCDQCGKHLITHRADARFCDERCRARWNNKHRVKPPATDIRIATADGGAGSRGGNVRSVTEARDLQSASKELDRWRLIMEQQVFRTLLATGYFHVDDLDCLDLPPAAFEVRGTLVNRVRAKGWMQRSGFERKVAHKAANARKAPIYRITAKGRAELSGLVGVSVHEASEDVAGLDSAELPVPPAPMSTHSGDSDLTGPGDGSAGQLPGKRDQGRPENPPSSASAASPESLTFLPEPDPGSWAA